MKKKSCLLLIALLALACIANAQSITPNYVKTTVYMDEANPPATNITTTYTDGLGRELQTHVVGGNVPLVVAKEYDEVGRLTISTKAFSATGAGANFLDDPLGKVKAYYNDEPHAYSEISYSKDPLSRITETQGVAATSQFGGRSSRIWYFGVVPGCTGEGCDQFDADGFILKDFLTTIILGNTADVEGATHFLTVAMDENSHFTQQLKDQFGNVVATWAHDSIDQKIVAKNRYDISGKILEETPPGNGLIGNTLYRYNTLGQLIWKKTPDAGIVVYLYNDAGQLKVVQDERQRNGFAGTNAFTAYNYDVLGRMVEIRENDYRSGSHTITDFISNPSLLNNTVDYGVLKVRNYYNELTSTDLTNLGISSALYDELKNLTGRLVASVSYDETELQTSAHRILEFFSYNDEGAVETKYKKIQDHALQKFAYSYDFKGTLISSAYYEDYVAAPTTPTYTKQ